MMDSRAIERIITACLVIFVGSFSVASAQTPFCSGDLCFIRLDPNSGATWSAAQQRCKENNATLPIADNPDHRMSFLAALSHLQIDTTMGVWLGANASDDGSDNWRWLNGDRYTGTDVQERGEYNKSYAYVAKKETEVKAYAAPPSSSNSYICQYISSIADVCTNGTGRNAFVRDNNRCYVKYDEQLSWFSARNKCLESNGDLASFAQLSLLNGIIVDSSGFWVGLRHSHFDWRNGVTGLSYDVTYTSWRTGQPNDAVPHCISTDTNDNFPNWRDWNCTESCSYICQALNGSTSSLPSTQVATPNTPSGSSSTTPSTSTTHTSTTTTSSSNSHSSLGTPERTRTSASTTNRNTTSDDSQTSHTNLVLTNESKAKSKDDNALAIGLGVGLGVPFLIIIVVIIIVLVLRRRRRNSAGNAHSTKKFVTNNGQNGADNGMEMTPKNKKGRKHSDSTPAHYATVREANPGSKVDSPSSQDVGYYADLRFASQGS